VRSTNYEAPDKVFYACVLLDVC